MSKNVRAITIEGVAADDEDTPLEIKQAAEVMENLVADMKKDKGDEWTGYVVLMYNILTFNKLLKHQEQEQASELLSSLIGGWVSRMLDLRWPGQERVHELTNDVQVMDAMLNKMKDKETMQ